MSGRDLAGRRAARRASRAAGKGARARWAARRLLHDADGGDRAAREAVAGIARSPRHRLRAVAGEAVAAWGGRTGGPG
ncbi:hypothetical protein, partial [Actinomadura verrucosospora]|uniref:hypothetical protein n=1 Tax=Actinomadura verrucosospora TaxID=46165 RepID=UPI001C20BE7E